MRRPVSETLDLVAVLDDARARLANRFERVDRGLTGLQDLDHVIGPVEVGRTVMITASHRGDATTLALQIMVRALRAGHPATLISNVWSVGGVVDRLIALVGDIDFHELDHGKLTAGVWMRAHTALAQMSRWDLAIRSPLTESADVTTTITGGRVDGDNPGRIPLMVIDGFDPVRSDGVLPATESQAASAMRVITAGLPECVHCPVDTHVNLVRDRQQVRANVERPSGPAIGLSLIQRDGNYFHSVCDRDDATRSDDDDFINR